MADDGFRLDWHGDEVEAVISGATFDGLQLAAEHLLKVSSALVPHEEGDLERSGDVDSDPADETVSVYYDRVYAVAQHEHLEWKHDEGRQAKYLEQPMNDDDERDTMLALIATAAGEPLS